MRRRRCAFCAAALAVLVSTAPARAEDRIAVLEFTGRKVDADFVEMLTERARHGALAASVGVDGYGVMTRENTLILTAQNGGSCREGECEVETGRLIGAALVLTGRVSLIERTFIVDLKLHETAKGKLVGATSVEHREQLATLKGTLDASRAMVAAALDRTERPAKGASAPESGSAAQLAATLPIAVPAAPPPVPAAVRPIPQAPAREVILPARLSDAEIREEVLLWYPAFQRCVAEQKAREPIASGTMKFRWAIGGDGTVRDVRCLEPDCESTRFAACVIGLVKTMTFPASRTARHDVTVPFAY
jgi:hypothetical protein